MRTTILRIVAAGFAATCAIGFAAPAVEQATLPTADTALADQRRMVELQIRNGELGPVPPTVAYRCQGLEAEPVTAVYYNQTEPPAAVITVGGQQVIAFIARSGSGARYTAPGVELWEHQGEATLKWNGNTYACKVP